MIQEAKVSRDTDGYKTNVFVEGSYPLGGVAFVLLKDKGEMGLCA